VTPSVPLTRRSNSLTSALGLGEKLFSSASERRFADAIEAGLDAVEAGLLREMSFADNLADVTSRYLLEAGGKRVRPTLTLLTAQLGNGNNDSVITAAEALEITHLASL
jgi:heptaprenyl diphosphate synthase